MALTARGYPYPVGTDRVMDGDNAIKALADKVDQRLNGGTWAVQMSVPFTALNTLTNVAITWPVGMFSAAPITVAVAQFGNPERMHQTVISVTPSGGTVSAILSAGTPAGVPVNIIAHAISNTA
jgi:hypothetical protein